MRLDNDRDTQTTYWPTHALTFSLKSFVSHHGIIQLTFDLRVCCFTTDKSPNYYECAFLLMMEFAIPSLTSAAETFLPPLAAAVSASGPWRERRNDGQTGHRREAVSDTGVRTDCSRALVSAPCFPIDAQTHLCTHTCTCT